MKEPCKECGSKFVPCDCYPIELSEPMKDKLAPFKRPVRYNVASRTIVDAEDRLVIQLRGGSLLIASKAYNGFEMPLKEALAKQDEISRYIADLINKDGGVEK